MAQRGDVIDNAVTGERIRFCETAADTGGAVLRLEVTPRPGGAVPLTHVHPRQEERFRILSGTGRFRVGSSAVTAQRGDELVAAPGVPHCFWNDGSTDLVVEADFRPALRTERFFEQLWEGPLTRGGMPRPRLALRLAAEGYLAEVAFPVVPLTAQRAAQSVLAATARLLGVAPRT